MLSGVYSHATPLAQKNTDTYTHIHTAKGVTQWNFPRTYDVRGAKHIRDSSAAESNAATVAGTRESFTRTCLPPIGLGDGRRVTADKVHCLRPHPFSVIHHRKGGSLSLTTDDWGLSDFPTRRPSESPIGAVHNRRRGCASAAANGKEKKREARKGGVGGGWWCPVQ